jgi:hypothetical protein
MKFDTELKEYEVLVKKVKLREFQKKIDERNQAVSSSETAKIY